MKIVKLILVFLIATQVNFAQEIDFGVKLGANFSTLNDASDAENKTGFVGGAFFGLKFSKIGFQTELLYSQQGAKFEASDFDLNYVNVPVLFKYYLVGGLNVQAGPQFGFLIDDNLSDFASDIESESFDMSAVAGVGIDLPLGIRADARYILGFSDVIEDVDGKNGVFTLSLGYSFL